MASWPVPARRQFLIGRSSMRWRVDSLQRDAEAVLPSSRNMPAARGAIRPSASGLVVFLSLTGSFIGSVKW